MNFDLNKYQTLMELHDEPSLESEIDYVPYLWTKGLTFSVKHWRDNLDNIIENE